MSKTQKWDQVKLARNFSVASSETDDAVLNFFRSLDCPKSLACWLLFSNKEYLQLVDQMVDPLDYNTSDGFRDAYAAVSFLSKADFLPTPIDKKTAALSKFREFEELCRLTNRRLQHYCQDPLYTGTCVRLLEATRRKVRDVLGAFSPEEFVDSAYWGPGVSTLIKGCGTAADNKFQSETGITPKLYDFIEPWFATAYPSWSEHLRKIGGFTMQRGNEVTTVPKNSKTDRVIAIEPGFNLFFQKGIGKMIRRRMKRAGIDLLSQEQNAVLAKYGSRDSSMATIDFSSASDSISIETVRELIPPEWFSIMDLCRCQIGKIDDSAFVWNKFSSMGNGFTFELESLIFFAAASAVEELVGGVSPSDRVSVYGDDVVISSSCVDHFSLYCEYLGFRVNPRKSFSSSYFRESCGAHYFNGSDVKPIYLKGRLSNVQSIFKLANSIRMLAHRRNSYCGCDIKFRDCWTRLYRRVPSQIRFGVSSGYGECGFFVNFDEATPSVARNGYEGFRVSALIETGVSLPFDGLGMLLARVSRGSEREMNNHVILRGRTELSVKKVLINQWYNLGGWL